ETEKGIRFNNFYGAEYISSKGYKVVIGSGVRFGGDCYGIPRIEIGTRNVGISEIISEELNCDHMVTSWAVRLNHPETTWPSMQAINNVTENQITAFGLDLSNNESKLNEIETNKDTEVLLKNIGVPLGGINMEHIRLLMDVSKGFHSIDILLEKNARFERPFVDNYIRIIYDIAIGSEKNATIGQLEKKVKSGKQMLSYFTGNLNQGKGYRDCLMHWVVGLKLCILRTEQAIAIINSYTYGVDRKIMEELLERNVSLMKEFEELWSESVTDYSLEEEKEIKFKRDIRMLENLLSN
ncbi:MAG: hypothetical protein GX815_03140, partial [Clostridiales bacterium]|nr:hypothetical protein [Clostridiales bacterium]